LEDVGEVDLVFDVIGGDIGSRSAGLVFLPRRVYNMSTDDGNLPPERWRPLLAAMTWIVAGA
jgi:hypothetical protein